MLVLNSISLVAGPTCIRNEIKYRPRPEIKKSLFLRFRVGKLSGPPKTRNGTQVGLSKGAIASKSQQFRSDIIIHKHGSYIAIDDPIPVKLPFVLSGTINYVPVGIR